MTPRIAEIAPLIAQELRQDPPPLLADVCAKFKICHRTLYRIAEAEGVEIRKNTTRKSNRRTKSKRLAPEVEQALADNPAVTVSQIQRMFGVSFETAKKMLIAARAGGKST